MPDPTPPWSLAEAFEAVVADGDGARAVVRRAHAERLCAGHFPGDPLVPGAYLLALMATLLAPLGAPRRLTLVERCTFRRPVRPHQAIVVTGRIRPAPDGAVTGDGEVRVDGLLAAAATMCFEGAS